MQKRDLILAALAVLLCLGVGLSIVSRQAAPTVSWGLSFRQEGQAPQGPAGQKELRDLDAAYLGDTSQPVIYLTFDAGYENGFTGQILDTLAKHNVSAVFFLTGHYLDTSPDLVRRMAAEGHTVGNHTAHHPDMSKLSDRAAFEEELFGVENKYREITGEEMPKFYRPPQGIYSQENLKMAKDLGYKTLFWSLAYADWDNNAQPEEEKALKTLLGRTHNGAVVLLHSTSRTNAEILDRLLTKWEEMGYRFGRAEELFG